MRLTGVRSPPDLTREVWWMINIDSLNLGATSEQKRETPRESVDAENEFYEGVPLMAA